MKKFSMKEIEELENKQYKKYLNRMHRAVYKYAKHGQHKCTVGCPDEVMATHIMRTLQREGLTVQRRGFSYIEITWDVLTID